jgi:TIR domain-containing protein
MSPDERVVTVFISYAHEDRRWCELLLDQLGALVNLGQIRAFDDSQIAVGTTWEPRIRQELESADIIVPIITAKFMRSKYCTAVELRRAMERFESGSVRVIPIVADHVDLGALPFQSLQMLPVDEQRNLKPLSDWKDDGARPLAEIARCIREAVEELRGAAAGASPSPPRPRSTVEARARRASRSPWLIGAGVIAVALVAAFVFWEGQAPPTTSSSSAPVSTPPPTVTEPANDPTPVKGKVTGRPDSPGNAARGGTVSVGVTPARGVPEPSSASTSRNVASDPTQSAVARGSTPTPTPDSGPPQVAASPPAVSPEEAQRQLFIRASELIACVDRNREDEKARRILIDVFHRGTSIPRNPSGILRFLKMEFSGATQEQQRQIVDGFNCI